MAISYEHFKTIENDKTIKVARFEQTEFNLEYVKLSTKKVWAFKRDWKNRSYTREDGKVIKWYQLITDYEFVRDRKRRRYHAHITTVNGFRVLVKRGKDEQNEK